VTVTPGTATWAERLSIRLNDVSTDEPDNLGLFLWLLRAKVSAGTWEVQLRYGYSLMDDDDFVRGPIVETSNTSWDYLEMGQAYVPIRDLQIIPASVLSVDVYEGTFMVQVWARRTAGAGTIDLDCLCPITLDIGWLVSKNIDAAYRGATDKDHFTYAVGPQDKKAAYTLFVNAGVVTVLAGVPTLSTDGLYLPPGDGRLYVVYAHATSSVITDVIAIGSLSPATQGYFERWSSLRGAE